MRIFVLFFIVITIVFPVGEVKAKPIIADLAIRSIEIDHDFAGITVLLFGAQIDVGDVVVVVRGPDESYVMRKKERIAGVWANKQSVKFTKAPVFYALASTRLLDRVRNERLLESLAIGPEQMKLINEPPKDGVDVAEFKQSFIRKKQEENLYVSKMSEIKYWGETLFRVPVRFPKNVSRGIYTVEVYLFRDGQLVAMQSTPLEISSVGMSAFLYDAAHRYSLFYGIACVFLALLAGWVASVSFKRV